MLKTALTLHSSIHALGRGVARARAAAVRGGVALSLAASLAAPTLLTPDLAHAADSWDVQVGAGVAPGPDGGVEAQAFGPDPLIIHAGDSVKWTFTSPHTVTFNAGKPELPLIVPAGTAGDVMFGPGYFPAGSPGSYDGSAQVSSGFMGDQPGQNFSLTFTKTGTFGYVCVLHPGMRGNVEVREAGAALPETPAQAKARGLATLATLAGRARQDAAMVRPVQAAGFTIVTAGVGDTFGASALMFVNGSPTINRGDTVIWTNADPFEIHTVTFTSGANPPDLVNPRPQPSGPPQLIIPANVAGPSGGSTYTGTGIVNSGIFGGGGAFALKFDAPPGKYNYLCLIHPFMTGTVTVAG